MRLLFAALLMLTAQTVYSAEIIKEQTYKWVDEKGQVGYADDLGKVPKKYRDSAVATEKQEQAVEIVDKVEPEKPSRKGEVNKRDVPADDEKIKPKPMFEGKSGDTWKQDFARQKNEVKSLEEQAVGIRERLAEGDKLSRNDFLSLQVTQRDLDVRITKAKQKLNKLIEAADRAELPEEYR